jgi:hypothetical protein
LEKFIAIATVLITPTAPNIPVLARVPAHVALCVVDAPAVYGFSAVAGFHAVAGVPDVATLLLLMPSLLLLVKKIKHFRPNSSQIRSPLLGT